MRACFVAERGARLLSADYSQVELRVLAHVAEEEVLKEIFRAGDDVHAATAAEVFDISREEVDVGQRSKAKMVNFGIVYGLTGFGLADRLNIPRKEGRNSSPATWSASRRCAPSASGSSSRPRRTAT